LWITGIGPEKLKRGKWLELGHVLQESRLLAPGGQKKNQKRIKRKKTVSKDVGTLLSLKEPDNWKKD